MGFFDKLKSGLGIGGVKVDLQVPAHISSTTATVNGKVVLTTKSDQEVKSVVIKLIEEWSNGRGADKKTKEYELGKTTLNEQFAIKTGETKEIPFTLDYHFLKSGNDMLKDGKTGLERGMGKFGSFMNNEKSVFYIHAEADVVSAAGMFDPSDKKEVKLVD